MADTRLRDAAIEYAQRGWAVFPLADGRKEPRFYGAYRRATKDLAQIRRWWRQFPEANIGLATGAASGIWVLDVDGPEGEASFVELVRHQSELPETAMVRTRKGWHLYWSLGEQPDPMRRIGSRPGLDVIGGNGYLLAPPSIHPSGMPYAWCDPSVQLAKSPRWLLQALLSRPEPVRAARYFAQSRGPGYLSGVTRRAVRDVLDAPKGTRNVQLFRAAVWALGVAEGLGQPAAPVEAELWAAAQSVGLTEIEIRRTLMSARIRARGNPRRETE